MKSVRIMAICLCFIMCLAKASTAIAFFGLFGDSNIDLVREGKFNFDKSITVGDALEGNQFLLNPEWESFEDTQKRTYVQFRADVNTAPLKSIASWKSISHIDIPIEIVIQFIVNKDDTFQLAYLACRSPILGDIYVPKQINLVESNIAYFYKNDLSLDLAGAIRNSLERGLQTAITSANIDHVKYCLNNGYKATTQNIRDALHSSPEVMCDIVQLLIDNGLEIEQNPPYLPKAMEAGNLALIQLLMQNGMRPTLINCIQYTKNHQFAVLQALLDSGVNPNELDFNDQSAAGIIIHSSRFSHEQKMTMLQLLLENGTNPNLTNSNGKTLLDINKTFNKGNQEIANLIMKYQNQAPLDTKQQSTEDVKYFRTNFDNVKAVGGKLIKTIKYDAVLQGDAGHPDLSQLLFIDEKNQEHYVFIMDTDFSNFFYDSSNMGKTFKLEIEVVDFHEYMAEASSQEEFLKGYAIIK